MEANARPERFDLLDYISMNTGYARMQYPVYAGGGI
jgi:hypothetical protein